MSELITKEFQEQIDDMKRKIFDISKVKGKPFLGDTWKEGDIPLYAFFTDDCQDLTMHIFSLRNIENIMKLYALCERGKIPKFIQISKSCHSCGKNQIYATINVRRVSEYRICSVCQDCYNKLNNEILIDLTLWINLNPVIPYYALPLCTAYYNVGSFKPTI